MPCGCPFGDPIVSRFSHFYTSIFDAWIYERKLRIYGATQGILIRFPANRLSVSFFFFLCIQHPTLIRRAQDFCFTMLELREGWCWILRKVCTTIESYRLSMTSRIMKAIPLMYALRKFPGTLAPQRMSRIHWHIFMTITRAEFIHVLVSRRFWSIPKRAAFILVYKLCTYVYCSLSLWNI